MSHDPKRRKAEEEAETKEDVIPESAYVIPMDLSPASTSSSSTTELLDMDTVTETLMAYTEGKKAVVFFTGRHTNQTEQQMLIYLAAEKRISYLGASVPPYNIKTNGKWDDTLAPTVTQVDPAVFGSHINIAVEAFLQHDAVRPILKRVVFPDLKPEFSSFVLHKFFKMDSIVEPWLPADAPWKKRWLEVRNQLSELAKLVSRVQTYGRHEDTDWYKACQKAIDEATSDEAKAWYTAEQEAFLNEHPKTEDLHRVMSINTSAQWAEFITEWCHLPNNWQDHMHVNTDDGTAPGTKAMLLSIFECPNDPVTGLDYDAVIKNKKRALEWVSKIFCVGFGIEGCKGDLFSIIFLVMQRAMQKHPDKFAEEADQVFLNVPDFTHSTASRELLEVMNRFLHHVSKGNVGLCVDGVEETIVSVHDAEGDDCLASIVVQLVKDQSGGVVQTFVQASKLLEDDDLHRLSEVSKACNPQQLVFLDDQATNHKPVAAFTKKRFAMLSQNQ